MAAKLAAIMVPRQVAGVMRTWAKRRVMTVAIEKATAISSARPSPIGETRPSKDSETMMATPQITAAIATQVAGATLSPKSRKARRAAISGTPACIKKDVGDGGVGERHDEGGRGGGEADGYRDARHAHVAEEFQSAAAAVAGKHEAEQEDRRPEGAPEDDRPAVLRLDEARHRAAEAPEERGEEDEQEAEALVPRRDMRRAVGRGGGFAHGSTVGNFPAGRCSPSDAAVRKSRRASRGPRRDPGESDGCGK